MATLSVVSEATQPAPAMKVAGTAPRFPQGLNPAAVAGRIVAAIVDGSTDLPSTAFAPSTDSGAGA